MTVEVKAHGLMVRSPTWRPQTQSISIGHRSRVTSCQHPGPPSGPPLTFNRGVGAAGGGHQHRVDVAALRASARAVVTAWSSRVEQVRAASAYTSASAATCPMS